VTAQRHISVTCRDWEGTIRCGIGSAILAELQNIYETARDETARDDLLQAIRRGAIQADGYRWIDHTNDRVWPPLRRVEPHPRLLVLGSVREYLEQDFVPLVDPFDRNMRSLAAREPQRLPG
jgi:hypothetical protein